MSARMVAGGMMLATLLGILWLRAMTLWFFHLL